MLHSPKLVNHPIFRDPPNRGIALLCILGMMTLPVYKLIAQQAAQPSVQSSPEPPAQPSTPPGPAKAPAGTWETRHAGEVVVEAPFPIEEGPDVLSRAPEKVRDTLISVKTFKAGSPKEGFQLTVTSIIYKPGVPVDIDEAIKGVTAKITAFVGDTDHKFIIAPAKVSGLEARHSEFHGIARNGRPFYAALAVVNQGQKLWEVQALCMNEAIVPDLARIMASIAIEPAP